MQYFCPQTSSIAFQTVIFKHILHTLSLFNQTITYEVYNLQIVVLSTEGQLCFVSMLIQDNDVDVLLDSIVQLFSVVILLVFSLSAAHLSGKQYIDLQRHLSCLLLHMDR